MEQYFPFHILREYDEVQTAIILSLAMLGTVWILAGLFYRVTKNH